MIDEQFEFIPIGHQAKVKKTKNISPGNLTLTRSLPEINILPEVYI